MTDTSPAQAASKESITIKKYANRRLYNTASSSYVTLEDLSALVKAGTEFNVYDARSGEDITREVLTQIIVAEEGKPDQQNLLPVGFLRQLIGFYGDNMQWMVPKYLEHSMGALSKNQEQMRSYLQTTFSPIFPFGSTLEEVGKQNLSMMERAMRMFTPFVPTTSCGVEVAAETSEEAQASVSEASNSCEPEQAVETKSAECAEAVCASAMPEPAPKLEVVPKSEPMEEIKTQAIVEPEKILPAPVASAPMATVTSIVRRVEPVEEVKISPPAPESKPETPSQPESPPAAVASVTPMPNVRSSVANSPSAEDMQQKIANLQRQLADLARNRG